MLRRRIQTWHFASSIFLSIATPAFAQTIIYPGTFDPFHSTHLEELKGALKLKNGKGAVVFPIQDAYYAEAGGQPFPKLIDPNLRIGLISDALATEGIAGNARGNLLVIRSNVFDAILHAYNGVADPEKFLLIGTDVLATWSQLPDFDEFLAKVRVIVSTDPTDPELTTRLRQHFRDHTQIEFADFKLAGIRAADIKQQLFSDFETARTSLPRSTGDFFAEHPEVLLNAGVKLNDRLKTYFSNQLVSALSRDLGITKFTLREFQVVVANFDVVEKFFQSPETFDPAAEQLAALLLPNDDHRATAERLRSLRRREDIDRVAARAKRSMAIMGAIDQRVTQARWNSGQECGKLKAELIESSFGLSKSLR